MDVNKRDWPQGVKVTIGARPLTCVCGNDEFFQPLPQAAPEEVECTKCGRRYDRDTGIEV